MLRDVLRARAGRHQEESGGEDVRGVLHSTIRLPDAPRHSEGLLTRCAEYIGRQMVAQAIAAVTHARQPPNSRDHATITPRSRHDHATIVYRTLVFVPIVLIRQGSPPKVQSPESRV